MNESNAVRTHYALDGLQHRMQTLLQNAGFDGTEPVDWQQFAPVDQFHVGGLEATQALAAALAPSQGESVLDVGCGFGGPARFLAATRGCQVTGLDLTPEYIEIARMLTAKTDLSPLLRFVQGDALALPFADASFDHAWTQHVAMNIADKTGLYREIGRVLKPGGRLAIYDFVQGNGEPVLYPVPWARTPEISFLATPDEMARSLQTAGFRIAAATDLTAFAKASFAALPTDAANPFNLLSVLGEYAKAAVGNLARNIAEGRVALRQVIAEKEA